MSKSKIRSGLRSLYRIEMQDGEVLELQTELSDVLRWESEHKGAAWMSFPMSLERQLWVAWRAAKRLNLTDVKLPDLWMNQILEFEDITPVDDDDDEDREDSETEQGPTPKAPSA